MESSLFAMWALRGSVSSLRVRAARANDGTVALYLDSGDTSLRLQLDDSKQFADLYVKIGMALQDVETVSLAK